MKDTIKRPVTYDGIKYIFDADGKMLFEVRGWGWIQYEPNAEERQDKMAQEFCDAFNSLAEKSPIIDIEKAAEEYAFKECGECPVEDVHNRWAKDFFGKKTAYLAGYQVCQGWIPVSEGLPNSAIPVLVCRNGIFMACTHYYLPNTKKWLGYGASQPTENITHWMPSPKDPENNL